MEQDGRALRSPTELEQSSFLQLQEAVGTVFSNYGWFILFGCLSSMFLINKLTGKIRKFLGPTRISRPVQDPDEVVRRQEAMAAARQKMQEDLNAQAEVFKERQMQLEEEKRRRKLEGWKSSKATLQVNQTPSPSTSTSSTASKPKTEKRPLRGSGFNPLTGDGGGACVWRPGRRGPSAGG